MTDQIATRSAQDQALELAAMNALVNYAGVRVWTDALDMRANNGILELGGHVRTHAEKEVTENVLLSVKGVKDVASQIYVDTDLEIAVAQALGNDARTRGSFPGILVGSAFGEVYLKGSAASQAIKKAAGEIAAKVDGVRSVNNQLEAPEPPKPAAPAAAKPASKPAAKPAPKAEAEETPAEE